MALRRPGAIRRPLSDLSRKVLFGCERTPPVRARAFANTFANTADSGLALTKYLKIKLDLAA
jgi:hypothetical protein